MAAKRLLIIDDAVFQSEILKEVFENVFGDKIDVEIALDYASTKEVLVKSDCDLILVDYLLGSIGTGDKLKDKVQKNIETNAQWIMMSALDVNVLAEQYRTDGFVKFIHKSDYSEMSEEISKALFH
jgi:DNA-binding NtrC family response regulator